MNNPLYATDQSNSSPSIANLGMAGSYKLPRRGARPISFMGSELAMAMSFTPGIPYWYEINLYRTDSQEFVVAIRLFYQSEMQNDRVSAWIFPNLEAALDQIETYDAAQDVMMPDKSLDQMVPAELTAVALHLKAEVDAQRHHYAGLAGELFMELEAAEEASA